MKYQHLDDAQTVPLVDQLVAVYMEVYEGEDPVFNSEDRYRRQLAGHMTAPGWELVTAEDDGDLVGYIYGFSLPAQTGWWRGLQTDMPQGFTTETGRRTFALGELMVREPWRGQGVAHRLHDELLGGRPEERAALLTEPDNDTAQAAYAGWGWRKVAQLRPSWEHAPLFDVLILPLVRATAPDQ